MTPIDRRIVLDKRKLEYFKNKLLKEKDQVMKTIELMEKHHPTDASMKEYTEELSSYDNHPADLGSEMFMMEMQNNLENHEKHRVLEIEDAIQKIKEGTYGNCQICGNKILEERLEIMPASITCIHCAEKEIESHKLSADRSVEEEILSPAFERSNKDNEDYTGFDGEDAYQAVAEFNKIQKDPSFATGDQLGIFDDYSIGSVEGIENISEEYYKSQLPYTGNKNNIEDSEDEGDI